MLGGYVSLVLSGELDSCGILGNWRRVQSWYIRCHNEQPELARLHADCTGTRNLVKYLILAYPLYNTSDETSHSFRFITRNTLVNNIRLEINAHHMKIGWKAGGKTNSTEYIHLPAQSEIQTADSK